MFTGILFLPSLFLYLVCVYCFYLFVYFFGFFPKLHMELFSAFLPVFVCVVGFPHMAFEDVSGGDSFEFVFGNLL